LKKQYAYARSIRSSPFPIHWLKPVTPFPFPFPRVCGWLKHDPIRRSRSMHAWYVGWVYRLLNLVENKSVVERKPFVFQFLSFVGDELQRNPKLRRFIFSS
jgi:hypothetical protein